MSFLDKVGNMFSKVSNSVGNFIKPIKHNVQQGLYKAGNWLDKNHETIGTIASGIGNILSNLPSGAASDKLRNAGNTMNTIGQGFHNYNGSSIQNYLTGFTRPSNISRTPPNAQPQQNQNPAINPVNTPIQQPAVGIQQQSAENNFGRLKARRRR